MTTRGPGSYASDTNPKIDDADALHKWGEGLPPASLDELCVSLNYALDLTARSLGLPAGALKTEELDQ